MRQRWIVWLEARPKLAWGGADKEFAAVKFTCHAETEKEAVDETWRSADARGWEIRRTMTAQTATLAYYYPHLPASRRKP